MHIAGLLHYRLYGEIGVGIWRERLRVTALLAPSPERREVASAAWTCQGLASLQPADMGRRVRRKGAAHAAGINRQALRGEHAGTRHQQQRRAPLPPQTGTWR